MRLRDDNCHRVVRLILFLYTLIKFNKNFRDSPYPFNSKVGEGLFESRFILTNYLRKQTAIFLFLVRRESSSLTLVREQLSLCDRTSSVKIIQNQEETSFSQYKLESRIIIYSTADHARKDEDFEDSRERF